MKQTNEKYINKAMAMMAAITTESLLLHENYDAMLYCNAASSHYVILIDYENDNPIEKFPNYSCSRWNEREYEEEPKREIALYFEY